MTRFSHLEFDQPAPRRNDEGVAGAPIRDEHFYVEQAITRWLAGDFEAALREYSRALRMNNAFFAGWLGQVRMLVELGEYRESELWADKALEMFPEHPELLAAKAVACARDAKMEQAIMYADNAMSREGVTAWVWLARAEVLLSAGHDRAETCLDNATAMAGNEPGHIRLQAGRILLRHRKHPGALAYLRQAVGELPQSPLAWYELGRCSDRLGLPEADTQYEHALELAPDFSDARAAQQAFAKRGLFDRLRRRIRRRREN